MTVISAVEGFTSRIDDVPPESHAPTALLQGRRSAVIWIRRPDWIETVCTKSSETSIRHQVIREISNHEQSQTAREEWETPSSSTAAVTDLRRVQDHITDHIEAVLAATLSNASDDSLSSELSIYLVGLVAQHSNRSLRCLDNLIASERIDPETAASVLQLLGEMNHPSSHLARLELLTRSLHHPSYWIRDGATLALALLDDPLSVPYLKRAIERERIAEMCENMEQVLAQLEETRLCRLS